ncbi:hypothetical protein [Maioricimonas sp. JC845]|uniref:hypothetical protein n=1 Tax=Maioricimonas sp. JC845 TaxID=3232138 RepID=UPI0034581730
METSLHQQLKQLYADEHDRREVSVDGYRIDAVVGEQLIEIQSASLGALREKVRTLLDSHDVLVVKPLAARKLLVKRARRGGKVQSRRRSPLKENIYNVFYDLVHFVDVFPHPRLTLHVLLTEQEEHRIPARKRRWKSKDYRVEDRRLVSVLETHEFREAEDLAALIPPDLPQPFTTEHLATATDQPRWMAQKIAYCLRKTGAATMVGKTGNALLYELQDVSQRAA